MNIGINASRARSGGGRVHLKGILSQAAPDQDGFNSIHLWSYKELLDSIPDKPWIIKHEISISKKPIFWQLAWELFCLPFYLNNNKCNILLNVDAGTLCRFKPSVTMSRDMLAFEKGEAERFGFTKERLRQFFLKIFQCISLTNSDGAIYLTEYASNIIKKTCGSTNQSRIISHGVGQEFRQVGMKKKRRLIDNSDIKIIYISPVWLYKHQWHVVTAVELLRRKGHNITLTLVGASEPEALKKLLHQISISDPHGEYVNYIEGVPHYEIVDFLANADIFVFASSCENMPNSLIEAMACGLPIACSNKGPMPEVLQDGGIYFEPEDPESIASAIEILVNNEDLLIKISEKALLISRSYSWEKCASETFSFIKFIYNKSLESMR
jgi:glycosyltransferase involved in cell wall biosynthesis